jgi:hypothetical protein
VPPKHSEFHPADPAGPLRGRNFPCVSVCFSGRSDARADSTIQYGATPHVTHRPAAQYSRSSGLLFSATHIIPPNSCLCALTKAATTPSPVLCLPPSAFCIPCSVLYFVFRVPFSLPRKFPSVSDIFSTLHLKKSIHFDQKGVFFKKRVYDIYGTLTIAPVSVIAGGRRASCNSAGEYQEYVNTLIRSSPSRTRHHPFQITPHGSRIITSVSPCLPVPCHLSREAAAVAGRVAGCRRADTHLCPLFLAPSGRGSKGSRL